MQCLETRAVNKTRKKPVNKIFIDESTFGKQAYTLFEKNAILFTLRH
jgi:hypothetical protein